MNSKTFSNSKPGRTSDALCEAIPQSKHEVVSKSRTLSNLISDFQEEISRGYGINNNTTYQIDRLIGNESLPEKGLCEADRDLPSLLYQLEDLIISLRILNSRNDTQYYRLQGFIGE